MRTIEYKIEFYSFWQCGSGLAAGADVDALAVKDRQGLPYVPGKTIKGLLRDAATIVAANQQKLIDEIFGVPGESGHSKAGCAFFSNATLSAEERQYVTENKLSGFLFRSVASTAIGDNGIASDNSLRRIEVVVPCALEARILHVPDDEKSVELLEDAMKYVKRMGTGRNRGYGRCCFSLKEKEERR